MVLFTSLISCKERGPLLKNEIIVTVVMYSFLDRPIFDILLNGFVLGAANKFGTTSMVTGIVIPIGEQKLSWTLGGPEGMHRNGEIDTIKNRVFVKSDDVPVHTEYMGVFLYPDNTAEFSFSEFMPTESNRGNEILKSHELHGRP
jgi:hypothetical protein